MMYKRKCKMTTRELRTARRRIEELEDKEPNILRLDELIKEKGISKHVLSNITGISPYKINKFLNNTFKTIEASEICVLCAFFNIQIYQLFRKKKTIIKTSEARMRDLF